MKSIHAFNLATRCLFVVIMMSLFLSGCKNSEPQLGTDKVKKLLTANTWKMQNVTIDGADKTSMFADLTLKFTNGNYTATPGGVVWPPSGMWAFEDETGKLILRSDGISINVQQVTATKLVVDFTWSTTTLGPGRTSSISGEHVFTFVK